MAAEIPLSELVLIAQSRAEDLGFVALHDVASILEGSDESRIIGGHMVQLHAYRWNLGADLYRQTQDADLGVPPIAIKDLELVDRLSALGYEREAGNRFSRAVTDLPQTASTGLAPRAVIDILVPAYTSRPRPNRRVSADVTTTEVPGLATALRRPAISISLDVRRLNGDQRVFPCLVPDEVAALVLKALAWNARAEQRDATDIWRCLEIANAAGLRIKDFKGSESATATETVRCAFEQRDSAGMAAIENANNLRSEGADRRFTRISALIERVLR
ncbi:MAG TPA: hypothetical protein VL769_04020 [Acidimicrobiia bacterium]|nr:hypothetical protein [Acidimicrobiia bacterium]